jgi:hypothetical protein
MLVTTRRQKAAYHKLRQLDYKEVAFGDVKGDVTLPKKQAKVHNAKSHNTDWRNTHHDCVRRTLTRSIGNWNSC